MGAEKTVQCSDIRCSDVNREPLAGTAKAGVNFLLLEHPGPWSHDILDGGTFGEDLTAQLKKFLKDTGFGLQLIRQPGRAGRKITEHNLYLVFGESEIIEHTIIQSPADILALTLAGPKHNQAEKIDHPMLLICTHAKRDRCCAIKGRPLAASVVPQFPARHVWESSHTKGHRFAPAMLLMPWNYFFGRMTATDTIAMFSAAQQGLLFLPGNRGRGSLTARGQVAELAVAAQLSRNQESVPIDSLHVIAEENNSVQVKHSDGRQWLVDLRQEEVPNVLASCGATPKTGKVWLAQKIHLLAR